MLSGTVFFCLRIEAWPMRKTLWPLASSRQDVEERRERQVV